MSSQDPVDELVAIETVEELRQWQQGQVVISVDVIRRILGRIQHLITADTRVALRLSEWAVLLASELNDPYAKGIAMRAKGAALTQVEERLQAIQYFNEAIAVFESIAGELEVAKTKALRMNAYTKLSNYVESLNDAGVVSETFARLGEERLLARHLVNVAQIHFRLDQFQEELLILERAEDILKRVGDRPALCQLYANRAVALTSLNQPAQAFHYYEICKRMAVELDMPALEAVCDYNVCYLHFLQGEYTRALELLHVVRDRMKTAGDRLHVALCNLDQSEIYLELNMHHDAIELAEQAYEGFDAIGYRYEMAKSLVYIGIAENHLHNHGKALQFFDQARPMFHQQNNAVWLSLIDLYQGIVYFQTGRYFEGLQLARQAHAFFLQQGLKTKATYARLLIARLNLQLNRLDEAWDDAHAALQTQAESRAPWLGYQIHYVIGSILERRDDTEGGRKSFEMAIEELEELRTNIHVDELRMTFLKDKLKIYEAFVRAGLKTGTPDTIRESFEAVERAKSRTLVDLLANNINAVPASRDTDSPLVDRLRTIREELNWYYTRMNLEEQKGVSVLSGSVQALVDEVRKREDQLIRLLRQIPSDQGGYITLHRVSTVSLEQTQASLPEDGILVEFYAVDERLLVFLVTRNDFQVVSAMSSFSGVKTAFDLLRFQLSKFALGPAYVEKFHDKLLAAANRHLADLYAELIKPIEKHLEGRRSIVFVPHDFLHYVPFHALFDGARYLIDRFEISYAPSATVYRTCVESPRQHGTVPLLMGVPDSRTPYIGDEIRGIQRIFPAALTFIGEEASSARLTELAPAASLIHIASHGSFRQDNPMFSSIQLGDTWLSLFDIYNLRTSASLVTLSGCGTGMSSVIAGDELLGLVRGFLYAGARSLLVSLWEVHDRVTAETMTRFYSSLADGVSLSASLRAAMIQAKAERKHPYYWAPFVLIGDPNG